MNLADDEYEQLYTRLVNVLPGFSGGRRRRLPALGVAGPGVPVDPDRMTALDCGHSKAGWELTPAAMIADV